MASNASFNLVHPEFLIYAGNQEQTIQSFQLLNYQNMNQIFDNIAD